MCSLKLLIVLLGPSWLLLGRSGPKTDPKTAPQIAADLARNRLKESLCKLKTLNLGLGFKMVPRLVFSLSPYGALSVLVIFRYFTQAVLTIALFDLQVDVANSRCFEAPAILKGF